jgi:hypothetical protein
LADAQVSLVLAGTSTTTDATGHFTLDASSRVRPGVGASASRREPSLVGDDIRFAFPSGSSIAVSILDPKGRQLARWNGTATGEEQALSLRACAGNLPDGLYLVRFAGPGFGRTFRHFRSERTAGGGAVLRPVVAARQATSEADAVDTLVVSKTVADVTSTRKVRVVSYTDDINTRAEGGRQILILDPSNDDDGDGLTNFEERFVHHTNAELADTDGDGVDDGTEVRDGRDPLVADVPAISFSMKSLPAVQATLTRTDGTTRQQDISRGGSYSSSSSFSSESQVNASLECAVMLGAEYNFAADGGATLKGEVTTTVGAGYGQTWSRQQESAMESNWSDATSLAASSEATITGGKVSVDIELVNKSSRDLVLVAPRIRLSTTGYASDDLGTLVGELTTLGDVYISSNPGANSVVSTFSAEIGNADLLQRIALRSSGMVAQLVNIQFAVSNGAIDTLMTNVYHRTAEVLVDPGWYSSASLVRRRVATRTRYNEFYTSQTDRYLPISIDEALRAAGVATVLDSTSGKFGIRSIGGLANGAYAGGVWSLVVQSATDSLRVFSPLLAGYDPRTIAAGGASEIAATYSADEDGDGLPGRIESLLGTSDHNADSDSDGVSDGREYFGWSRDGDPSGTSWKTDPRRRDTDGDGLDDGIDPNPVVPAVDPQDSTVSVASISIVPSQGSVWTVSGPLADSNATISVGRTVRGNSRISFRFAHPVQAVRIVRRGGDTLLVTVPDAGSTATYSAPLHLVLGDDAVDVAAWSRSGTFRQRLSLTGIARRLVQLDASGDLCRISAASDDSSDRAANATAQFDRIKALDSLVTGVHLFRTRAFAAPLAAGDSARIRGIEDLGDAGDGRVLGVGGSTPGKAGLAGPYILDHVFTTTETFRDTVLQRDDDQAFFFVASHADQGANWFSTPTSSAYFKPNRDIVLDSLRLSMICNRNWGGGLTPWHVILRARVAVGTDTVSASGWTGIDDWVSAPLTIPAADPQQVDWTLPLHQVAADGVPILFPDDMAQFVRLDVSTWKDNAKIPKSVPHWVVTHPQVNKDSLSGWVKLGTETETRFNGAYTETAPAGNVLQVFDDIFQIFWHYRVKSR